MALLCLLLGWAEGVRRDTRYLHVPETGHWLIAMAILGGVGVLFLLWSRGGRRQLRGSETRATAPARERA